MGETSLFNYENRINRSIKANKQMRNLPASFMEPKNQNELNSILRDRQFELENEKANVNLSKNLNNFKKAVSILLLAGTYAYSGTNNSRNNSHLILPAEYIKQLEAMALPCSGLNGKTKCKYSTDDRLWASGKLSEYKNILKKSVNQQLNRQSIRKATNKSKKLRNNSKVKTNTKRRSQPSRKGRGNNKKSRRK